MTPTPKEVRTIADDIEHLLREHARYVEAAAMVQSLLDAFDEVRQYLPEDRTLQYSEKCAIRVAESCRMKLKQWRSEDEQVHNQDA